MISCEAGMIGPGEVIVSSRWAETQDDEVLLRAVRRMQELSQHPYLIQTHLSGSRSFGSIEEFLAAALQHEVSRASAAMRGKLTKRRRAEFGSIQTSVVLALIERDGYVCRHPGCSQLTDLTVDHIIPVSKGGTDDIANLRFLCRFHNSKKGANIDA